MAATELDYKFVTYDTLSIKQLNELSLFEGIFLTNKEMYPYFVSRVTTGRTANTPQTINTNIKIEDGFGNLLLLGTAEEVYEKLYVLTDSDVPF